MLIWELHAAYSKVAGTRPRSMGTEIILCTVGILNCVSEEVLTKPSKEQSKIDRNYRGGGKVLGFL